MTVEPTGVPGFDELVAGGLPSRRLVLVQGAPGSGKSTFGMQFLLEGVRRKQRSLYVTLSESEEEIRGVAESHGWSFEGIHIHDLSRVQDLLEDDQDNSLFNPADVELKETTQPVLDLIAAHEPERVVFDSLSELRMLASSPLRYRRRVLALKQHLAKHHCTTLFLDDGTSDPNGDLQLQSLAHGVITLAQWAPSYGAERRTIRVQKMRGIPINGGVHELTIERGGARVFRRLSPSDHAGEPSLTEMVRSGVPALDAILGGGPPRGTSTLVAGPAGSGKSVLLGVYAAAAAARGERVALFLFEETRASFLARSAGVGLDLRRYVDAGVITLRTVDPAELSPWQFAHILLDSVDAGATIIGIDSLNGYKNAMPDESALNLQLHELLSVLAARNVTTFIVMVQHGAFEAQSPIDISYIADNVLLLRFFESAGRVLKALSVLKKRAGAHEATIRELQIGAQGIEVGPPLSQFEAILSGAPHFVGPSRELLKP